VLGDEQETPPFLRVEVAFERDLLVDRLPIPLDRVAGLAVLREDPVVPKAQLDAIEPEIVALRVGAEDDRRAGAETGQDHPVRSQLFQTLDRHERRGIRSTGIERQELRRGLGVLPDADPFSRHSRLLFPA
jgi:hypothetical protein